MRILIDAIPMTGLLTGIARYLRNLYHAVNRLNLADTAYFNGRELFETMPPMADAGPVAADDRFGAAPARSGCVRVAGRSVAPV